MRARYRSWDVWLLRFLFWGRHRSNELGLKDEKWCVEAVKVAKISGEFLFQKCRQRVKEVGATSLVAPRLKLQCHIDLLYLLCP